MKTEYYIVENKNGQSETRFYTAKEDIVFNLHSLKKNYPFSEFITFKRTITEKIVDETDLTPV